MKKIIIFISFFSSMAFAQMPPGFNAENMKDMEKNMQAIMSNMANMEQCMSRVDESKIDALGDKADKLQQQVEQLCQQGKRSAAQNKVIQFSKEMRANKDLQQMKKCMAPMGGMMKSMPFEEMYKDLDSNNQHVCGQ